MLSELAAAPLGQRPAPAAGMAGASAAASADSVPAAAATSDNRVSFETSDHQQMPFKSIQTGLIRHKDPVVLDYIHPLPTFFRLTV